jgi:hypothetical protein
VRAAAESVYDSLINSDFMIGLLDFLTKLISKVELVTKALGGVGGILTSIGMWIIKIKREEITAGLARTG